MANGQGRGRHPDRVRVVAAQVGGTAERCVIGHGITDDEALVEIGGSLAALGPGHPREEALAYAAARYVGDTDDAAIAITTLLERAGADLERARAIRSARGTGFVIR